MFGLDLFALLVIGFIAVAAVIVVIISIVVVSAASKNREAARLTGVDTVEGQAQHPIEVRLHELDGLRARGVITYDEYVAARQRAIDGTPAA